MPEIIRSDTDVLRMPFDDNADLEHLPELAEISQDFLAVGLLAGTSGFDLNVWVPADRAPKGCGIGLLYNVISSGSNLGYRGHHES